MRFWTRLLLVSLLLSLGGSALAAPRYYIVDIGSVWAEAVNEDGDVAGYFRYAGAGSAYHAFSILDGVLVDHGTLGGAYSYGRGINDLGETVGESQTSDFTRGFVVIDGVMTELGVLLEMLGSYSQASAINNSGQIAGFSTAHMNGYAHAFVTIDGVMTDLGTLGGNSSYAYGINEFGEVTGWSKLPDGSNRAFATVGGVMTDLGTLAGDTDSGAKAINDLGQVVGQSYIWIPHPYIGSVKYGTAFLTVDAVMTDLGALPGAETSEAHAVNNQGQVVGTSENTAFYYDDEVGMVELASLVIDMGDWTELQFARDINEQGVVIGYTGGRSFKLIPATAHPVPVLGNVGLLMLASILMCIAPLWLRFRVTRRS